MPSSARDSYLETEVMTATPQKLQFMLLDAAIRAIQQTKQLWEADRDEQACETLIRAQRIVSELLCGLNQEIDPGLARKVAAIYLFVFRNLVDANQQRDVEKLEGALSVLEIERETWRRVCEELGSTKAADGPAPQRPPAPISPPVADFSSEPGTASDMPTGFSIEA